MGCECNNPLGFGEDDEGIQRKSERKSLQDKKLNEQKFNKAGFFDDESPNKYNNFLDNIDKSVNKNQNYKGLEFEEDPQNNQNIWGGNKDYSSKLQSKNLKLQGSNNNNLFNFNKNNNNGGMNGDFDSEGFSKYIFEKINQLRTNPRSFIPIIENAKANIGKDTLGRFVYKGPIKVALYRGIPAFDDAIQYLAQTPGMEKLIYNPQISVDLPNNEEDIQNKKYLQGKVKELAEQGIFIKSYWRDIVKDKETCFLLMVIDDSKDNSGLKRKDILDPNMKYMGINSGIVGKSFVSYMTFCKA